MKDSLRTHGWYLFGKRYCFAIFILALVSACFLLFAPSSTSALTTVPTKMNFQGRLTDSAGNIKPNGTYNMKLRLYTVSSGGSSVWSEDRLVSATQGVTVTNGLFSVKLGDITSLPASHFASGELYLEVELPTPASATTSSPVWTEGAMTPRNQMATSAYAYNAETLDGIDSASFAQIGASNLFAAAQTINVSSTGAFDVQNGSSISVFKVDTSAAAVTIAANTTIAAEKSITVVGGNTASRPASPVEGMIYYDTTTKKLEVYSNGKWQADRSDAVLVAASDSSQADKDAADYVADGNTGAAADGDQVQINSALTAGSGKKVVLLAGTYVVDDSISVPNNTTLSGIGLGSVIEVGSDGSLVSAVVNADTITGTGIVVRDIKLDGRSDINATASGWGVELHGMGSGSGATAVTGAKLINLYITRFGYSGIGIYDSANNEINGVTSKEVEYGIELSNTDNTVITNSHFQDNEYGIYLSGGGERNKVTNNDVSAANYQGMYIGDIHSIVSGNTIENSGYSGIDIDDTHNTVSNNIVLGSAEVGIEVDASYNIVSANQLYDNGGITTNNAIFVDGHDNIITTNYVDDSSCTTDCFAINIDTGSGSNYLADNTLGGGSINDLGNDTIYAGQVDDSGNLRLQPAGTIELQKNTNVTGTLQATGDVTASSGTLTVGTTSVAGNVVISDGSSNTATIVVGSLAGDYTYSIPATTANDTFCLVTLANCAGGGVTSVGAYSTSNTAAGGATISGSSIIFQDASATAPGMVGTGTQTFAGNKTFNGTLSVNDVSVATGKSVSIVGGNTASRPASPTEGMIYYDQTTDQLLAYANGKWQADRTESVIVAASNSSQADKDAADYVADGNGGGAGDGDQVQINQALTAASGKKVVLLAGTYVADATILVPNNTTLAGVGKGTLIELADLDASDNLIENSDTTTGTNIAIRDLQLNGRKDLNTAGTQRGIILNGMGGGTGATARQGALITGVFVTSFKNENIYLTNSSNNTISNITSQASTMEGLQLTSSANNNVITGNKFQGNGASGFNANSTSNSNTISSNHAQGNGSAGFSMASGTYNTFSGNTSIGNSYGFFIISSTNTITGNNAQGNSSSGYYASGNNNSLTGNTTNGGSYGFDISGNNNDVTGNTTQASLYGIIVDGDYTTVSGNNITTATTYGIYVNSANSNVVTGNKIHDSGGATTNNGIYLQTSDSNSITGNSITDTSATTNNYAINVSNATSDTTYLADNTLGGGSINDLGTGTIYANQLNSSNQFVNRSTGGFAIQGTAGTNLFSTADVASVTIGTSDTTGTVFVLDTKTDAGDPTGILGGMYYNSNAGEFRCYQVSAWKNCDDGGDATTVDGLDSTAFARVGAANTFTFAQVINVASTAAFDIQNGSAVSVFKVDSSTSTVTLGTATNGSVFTSTGVSYVGTARPTRTITLSPEYAGATFTADGSNNNGSLSSDFCSSSSLLNMNAAACPSAADEHNYYAWTTTQGTAQDYDLYVRYQMPSDYDTGSMTNMKLTAMGTLGANEIASLDLYKGSATACGTITDAISSNATWATSTNASPLGACTIAAGDMITFKIKLTAVSNGVARAGDISFSYRSKF